MSRTVNLAMFDKYNDKILELRLLEASALNLASIEYRWVACNGNPEFDHDWSDWVSMDEVAEVSYMSLEELVRKVGQYYSAQHPTMFYVLHEVPI